MATFGFFNNDALEVPITDKELLHFTDQSENPTDFSYFYGSLNAARQLIRVTGAGINMLTFTIVDNLPEWEQDHVYALGARVQETGGGDWVFEVTARTGSFESDGTEPAWGGMGGIGSTIIDNDLTWTKRSAHHKTDEITLALTEGELATNTPGDPLEVDTTLDGGVANDVQIWFRVVNAVTNVSNSTSQPEIVIRMLDAIEIEP